MVKFLCSAMRSQFPSDGDTSKVRIAMGGKHFPMGVDIDPGSLGLL